MAIPTAFPSSIAKPLAATLVAALLAAAPIGQAGAQQGAPPPQVTVVELAARDVPLTFQYAARISAFREVQVRARVGGILLERKFTEGARVKAGDILFVIDPDRYEAALAEAKARLQQAVAQHNQAVRDAERAASLYEKNIGSEKARDDAVSNEELTRAAMAAAEAAVKTAQLNLDYTQVTAPISGVTSLEEVPEGSLIGTGSDASLLTSITQLDPVYVNFSFSDAEAADIRRLLARQEERGGHSTELKVAIAFRDGTAYEREGTIDFTASSIDVSTGTLRARAVVANPEGRLIPGQFVRATIKGLTLDGAIVVPEGALMQGPKGQFVYTVDTEGKAQARPVTTGAQVEGGFVILSGLAAGDRLITEGVIKVRPGAAVAATPPVTKADLAARQ
ncbi:membrane fusion protein (multidrug efflux system) [Chelatococcus caeni]|uniref:Membrane fusion protein (Multidrug efflux system) n=1 Tax=Chelatococcus caeni TaxID=1348468 RepID=A0A840C173_9HYPH|nr:efflux RND transporter periplasmic adaptor subunit [Chelatococcus caeni]MBB4018553.1 membrane fusion protein (multidrug efflux system) [Chelatococcus caeni]